MADNTTYTAEPYVEYQADEYTPQEVQDGASWELGAGHFELGFVVNGAKVPLARLKGGGVLKKIAAAKANAAANAASQTDTSTSTTDTSTSTA